MKKIEFLTPILISLVALTTSKVQAQKLPATQKESVLAPSNIKIDGKTDEWDNQFKAYNKSREIFYTIANDNKNLYLIIQATRYSIIDKITGDGITFTIKNSGDSKTVVPVAITYPIIPKAYRPHILHQLSDTSVNMADALPGLNKELSAHAQDIIVTGFDDITDSVISVYNEHGIKVAGLFNMNKALTYEFAIPLKYINQLTTNAGELKYNIKVNGLTVNSYNIVINGKAANAADEKTMALLNEITLQPGSKLMDQMSATDLSGTYKLAK